MFARREWRRTVLAIGLLWTLVPPAVAALPLYPLYYAFDVPLALQGLVLGADATQTTYTGTLRGSLGGVPLRSSSFTYGTGASKGAGGGTFSLATAAGDVRNGRILMTTDGTHTTLLFFGLYLGTRLEFSLQGDAPQIGGSGVTAIGLARTGFASHEEYIAAVRRAAESLDPASREQIVTQADANPGLVNEYQRKLPH